MSQRVSGYERKELDCYETPEWVTQALVPYLPPRSTIIHEPAFGTGKIADALVRAGFTVTSNDLSRGCDFLSTHALEEAIVTNPPYRQAQAFIEKALELAPFVAMLLRTDFHHAKTRRHLFAGCPWFAKKLVLTKRIVWFERPGAAPSFNHAWFIWDKSHSGLPSIVYGP